MGKLVFVSGPAGMGKTKVKEKLEALSDALGINFERVIVDTSRNMRPCESQGDPWYFKKASEIERNDCALRALIVQELRI